MKKSMKRFNSWKKTPKTVQSARSFKDVVERRKTNPSAVTLICDGGCTSGCDGGGAWGDDN